MATVRGGAGASRVKGARESHRAGKAAVASFGKMESRLSVECECELGANDEQRAASDGDPDGVGRDARDVHHDFQGRRGLEDVERRPAIGGDGRGPRDIALDFSQEPSGILGEFRGAFIA